MLLLKTHLLTPLYRSIYLQVAMRALATIFGFIFWALAARLLPAADVGLASGLIAAAMLLSGLAQLGLGYGLTRHLPTAEDPNRLLSLALTASAGTGLALSVTFLVLLRWLSPALVPIYHSPIYMLFFVLLVVNWSLSVLLHWIFVAKRQVIYSFTRQAGHMVIAVALLFALHYAMPDFTAVLVAHTVAVIASVAFSWQALSKVQPGFRYTFAPRDIAHPTVRSSFARFSVVTYISDQFHRVPDTILPLLIINQFGPGTGAYFFVVWTIGRAVSSWVSSMSQSVFAEGANDPESAGVTIRKATVLGVVLSGGMALGVILCGPWILGIYGQSYVDQGLGLLDFVASAAVPTVLIALFTSMLLIHNRLRAMIVLRITDSITGLVFIYFGISRMGFVGAGIGWLASQIVVLVGCQIWWQWQKQHNLDPSVASKVEQAEPGV